jgi:hypothetical protein
MGFLQAIRNLIRVWIWARTNKVSEGRCKVKWKVMCRSSSLSGLGVLNLIIFSHALCVRWPWLEWTDPESPWVGPKLPRNKEGTGLFYSLTEVTIGDEKKAGFFSAPSIFRPLEKEFLDGSEGLTWNAWIQNINYSNGSLSSTPRGVHLALALYISTPSLWWCSWIVRLEAHFFRNLLILRLRF